MTARYWKFFFTIDIERKYVPTSDDTCTYTWFRKNECAKARYTTYLATLLPVNDKLPDTANVMAGRSHID